MIVFGSIHGDLRVFLQRIHQRMSLPSFSRIGRPISRKIADKQAKKISSRAKENKIEYNCYD